MGGGYKAAVGDSRVFAKCAWRLLPLITAAYVANFLDRVNVGFAALTMNRDLGFSPTVFGIAGGILFIGYALFQVPANFVLQQLGARRWMFTIMLCWGVISASCAFARTPLQFYTLRFLLGVAESGLYPGMVFYLTTWFPREYRGRFIASFSAGIPISFLIGGPLSSLLLQLDGLDGLHGWQWLFICEALPALILAFAMIALLPDGPARAPWLSDDDRISIAAALSRESGSEVSAYWPVLRDLRVIIMGLIQFCFAGATAAYLLWLPQIVNGMGYSTLETGFIVAAIFVGFVPSMVLWARHSDANDERIWHTAVPALISAVGFAAAAAAGESVIALLALAFAGVGLFLCYGPLFSLPSVLLRGAAVACAIALLNSIGMVGGFVAPVAVGTLNQATEGYTAPLMVLAGVMLASAVITLMLGSAIEAQLAKQQAVSARA